MNTTEAVVSAIPSTRFFGWVFCASGALNGRALVVQANSDTLVGFTDTGRLILARGKAGEVGQKWVDGEFHSEELTGVGYAFLGETGSVQFADEIGATKVCPSDRFESCPQLPHHQFSDKGTVEQFPGLVSSLQQALEKGNFFGVRKYLGALEAIASFSRTEEAWHWTDLP